MKHEKPGTENIIISNFLKVLILLSPLPFGCVGRIFSPLFLMLMLVLSFIALGQPGGGVQFLAKKKIQYVFIAFLGFLGFQLLPLPPFLLKLVSPTAANHITQLTGQLSGFHPISMVPFETLMFGFRFLVYALFFLALLHVHFKKKEMISIFKILVLSSVLQVILGLLKYLHGNKYFFLFFHKLAEHDPLQKYLTGTLGNPNHFAFYLGMVLPLFLALLFLKLLIQVNFFPCLPQNFKFFPEVFCKPGVPDFHDRKDAVFILRVGLEKDYHAVINYPEIRVKVLAEPYVKAFFQFPESFLPLH